MSKVFPYKARFGGGVVKASVDESIDKYLSKASLEDLKKLDINSIVNLEDNVDLIGTVFNAAVINRLNKNDDGISTETALAIKDLFAHKPHNLEHKSQRIVGHIVKAGWSTYGGNQMISDEEAAKLTEPFNLVLGGVVYRTIDEKFADLLIEASDESSDKYMIIATSWEIAFTKYNLVLGSKNVNEAEIVSDPDKIEELKQHLRCNGGTGKLPDGRYIGRLIVGGVGDVLPIGVAFTTRPAADVEGVLSFDWSQVEESVAKAEDDDTDEDEEDEDDEETPENKDKKNDKNTEEDEEDDEEKDDKEKDESLSSTQKSENNSSQIIESVVKNNNQENIAMKFKNIQELVAAVASKTSVSEASVSEFIQEQIELKSKEFETKANEKETALKTASEKAAQLEADLATANAKIAEVQASLQKLESEASAKAKQESFQTRMSALANEFELSDKESALITKEIVGLDDTAYASWYEKFSVLADSKKKTVIAAAKEAFDTKVKEEAIKLSEASKSTASVTPAPTAETAAAALEKVTEAPKQSIANVTTPETKTDFRKEWADAFGGTNLIVTK